MIRLHRGPEPQFLKDNKAAWSERFTIDPPPADWATKEAKERIRAELQKLGLGKCSYCEGRPEETGYIEIEHYHPKSRHKELVFEWANLFPACRRCNGSKREEDHQGSLVKPDEEDPKALLWLNLDTGKLEPKHGVDPQQQARVEATIRICDLNRGALCIARLQVWRMVKHTLVRLAQEASSPTPETLTDMREILKPLQVHKFAVRFALALDDEEELLRKDRADFEAASRAS